MKNNNQSLSERNQRILSRYADGATLEEVGELEGLTRERVRQIVQQHGGPDAEAARAARRAIRVAETMRARKLFLEFFGEMASGLAQKGFTRPLAIARMKIFFPGLDVDVAEDVLMESDIRFDQDNGADTFSNIALEAGIWYLLGSELGLKPEQAWAAVNLPQELLDELAAHLINAAVTPDELATILGIIGAAQRQAHDDQSLSITGSRYNELRGELLDAFGLKSAKGAKPWPPTRQTITKRYEGWNDALESMGLAIASKGRPKGLLHFSERDYAQAIVDFTDASVESGTGQTFANYGLWVRSQSEAGSRRPSPASIRNFYGAWLTALRNAPRSAMATLAVAQHSDPAVSAV